MNVHLFMLLITVSQDPYNSSTACWRYCTKSSVRCTFCLFRIERTSYKLVPVGESAVQLSHCGQGVLGRALKQKHPHCSVTTNRDLLDHTAVKTQSQTLTSLYPETHKKNTSTGETRRISHPARFALSTS